MGATQLHALFCVPREPCDTHFSERQILWKRIKKEKRVALFLDYAIIISNLASLAGQVFTLLHYPLLLIFPIKKQPALYLPLDDYRLVVISNIIRLEELSCWLILYLINSSY